LSGGQQQRVAIARAIVIEPPLVLMDEPLSNLDAKLRIETRAEIRRIHRELGRATIYVTHDQDEALSLADRIAVLREGRLVQVATPQQLYDHPADAFVASFVGRANLIDGTALAGSGADTPLGCIATPPHGLASGARVRLLVRPERVEPVVDASGENVFAVEIVHDRFFGASRQLELAVAQGHLKVDTAVRGPIAHVRVPPDAVQFLPVS